MKKCIIVLIVLLVFSYGDWILSTEAAPASIAKQISVPGDYQKISDAVHDGVPTGNNEWILIKVAPGVYTDTVTVPANKPYVIIQGGGKDNTILAWKSANKGLADAPLIVRASNFIAKDITFKNTYNLNEVAPAVAGFVQGDKCSFYQCNFLGVQDTLADYNGRHFFSSCYIEGTTDFIFGDGTSIYQDCTINATGSGYITAQGREQANEASGFVFKSANVIGKGPTYLGRAWRAYSRVLFYQSTFADIIDPKGWDAWGNPENQLSYSEVNCTGPGATQAGRVSWMKNLSPNELGGLVNMSFIDQEGWLENQPSL
ncbi:putative pectinesterase 55 [Vitis vinifera]|uniref:Pectinesterase n=1 Tax=Vitis vinifera TaxID=29760 RepID=A0A438CBV0_VITVI|nr:putative pectinesterase 55 [Vitis vinifera]